MPRPLRVEYEGASYHVMARGNRGCRLFATEWDETTFLNTLAETQERTGWLIHAWVLMSTHYHLLIETPQPNLVFGMKWMQGTYTQRYNAYHEEWGHLFQGRYKAKVIDPEDPEYFKRVADYIHLNPAEAGLLSKEKPILSAYLKSSYPLYLAPPGKRPSWLVTERVFSSHNIGSSSPKGRKLYEAVMQKNTMELLERKGKASWWDEQKKLTRGWVHGSKEFRRAMADYLAGTRGSPRVYDRQQGRDVHESTAESALVQALKIIEVKQEWLREMKKGDSRKLLLAGWLRRHYPVTRKWVAKQLYIGHENRVTAGDKVYREATGTLEQMRIRLDEIVELSG